MWNFAFNDTQNNDAFNLSGSATGPWIPFFGTDVAFQINGTTVPDTGSTITLLGFASLGLVALRRKLRC